MKTILTKMAEIHTKLNATESTDVLRNIIFSACLWYHIITVFLFSSNGNYLLHLCRLRNSEELFCSFYDVARIYLHFQRL